MAYSKHTWLDESVEHARRYDLKDTSSGTTIATYDLERVTGTVTEQDSINASKLNNIEKGVHDLAEPITPSSGTSASIVITTVGNNSMFTLKISADIEASTITIARNSATAKTLKMPNGDNVEELLAENTYYKVVEEASNFTLAPSGGAGGIAPETGIFYHAAAGRSVSYTQSITGKGFMVGFSNNHTSQSEGMAIKIDGTILSPSTSSKGFGAIGPYFSIIPFQTSLSLESEDSSNCHVFYVLGDKLSDPTGVGSLNGSGSSSGTSLRKTITGSGYLTSFDVPHNSKILIDGDVLIDRALGSYSVLRGGVFIKFNSSIQVYSSLTSMALGYFFE